MSVDMDKEKEEKSRTYSKNYYEKNKKKIKEKARERYKKKKEEGGEKVGPRGRPRKYKTTNESQLTKQEHNKISRYINLLEEGIILSDEEMDKMIKNDKKCLMVALLNEQRRYRDAMKNK